MYQKEKKTKEKSCLTVKKLHKLYIFIFYFFQFYRNGNTGHVAVRHEPVRVAQLQRTAVRRQPADQLVGEIDQLSGHATF